MSPSGLRPPIRFGLPRPGTLIPSTFNDCPDLVAYRPLLDPGAFLTQAGLRIPDTNKRESAIPVAQSNPPYRADLN